jgi:osmotically-inducible protein OsmY
MTRSALAIITLLALLPALHGCFLPVVAAGAGAGVLVAEDRRSTGTMIDDKSIQAKASRRINEKYNTDDIHVDVNSYNRFVLLVGEVPSQQVKDDMGAIALGVENARNIQNELVVGPVTSTGTRANDAYLTSKVKGRFVSENKFKPNVVKVITENGVVYLMGLVTKAEGDAAAEIASSTTDVVRVVKVFEYTG